MQNGEANYYYYRDVDKITYINNYRLPMRDLRTRRLPTDISEFTEFLDQIEGRIPELIYKRDPDTGLLVGALDDRFYNAREFQSKIAYNQLNETDFGSFRYPLPKDAPVVDERDAMHKRGWTYFRINGEINHRQVTGLGQIPFVYAMLDERPPWLRFSIADSLEIVDIPSGAYLTTADRRPVAAYLPGSFFKGLSRPWMGMHTIDIVRRDAAKKRIKFSTRNFGGDEEHYGTAEIILFIQSDHQQLKVIYTINIDRDLVERIDFLVNANIADEKKGWLEFTYLDQVEQVTNYFLKPPQIKLPRAAQRDGTGILWLIHLIQETLE